MGPETGPTGLHRTRRRELIQRLQSTGVSDLAVLHAFDRVPRHLFVPELFQARAYADEALPIGHGQTISRPATHAIYLQALELTGRERVLEIGTGSGYQTALLATLAERVFSIERLPELAREARDRIESLGFTNVVVRAGDGSYGWKRYAPFDAILVAACAREVPQPLIDQLAPEGRLLIPLADDESQQLHLFVRTAGTDLQDRVLGQVRFVPLTGDSGEDPPEQRAFPC